MTARLLEGKVFAQKIKDEAQEEALALRTVLGRMPGLAVVIVGEDPASEVYVRNKERACEALGFFSALIALPETTTKEDLLAEIDRLNASRRIDGILVQLPLRRARRRSSSASTRKRTSTVSIRSISAASWRGKKRSCRARLQAA